MNFWSISLFCRRYCAYKEYYALSWCVAMKIAKERVTNEFPLIILEKVEIESICVRMSHIG